MATKAQQEKAKARRAAMRELAERVANMSEERRDEIAALGIRTIEGHELSMRNQGLVALQNPQASIVGGFRQWKNAGRSVRKGEHGYGIWVPMPTTTALDKPEDDTDDDKPRFRIGYVFDVSQTEALEAKEAA